MIVDMQTTFKTSVKEVYDDDDSNVNDGYVLCEINNENREEKHKNGDSSASMAENARRANKSLCDIPFYITMELMKSLDTNRGWEALAAEAGYTFDQMQLLSLEQNKPDGSPTRILLWQLGCRGYRITDLYDKLKDADRLREMQTLEAYVKAGEHEGKGAAAEKKVSESSSLFSLPRLLSQVKVSDQKSMSRSESGSSMMGSEINFNHPSFIGKSKSAVDGSKNYEDKFIPGTEDRRYGSFFGTCNNENVGKANHSIDRSMPKDNYKMPLPTAFLDSEKDTDHVSLPPSFSPPFCSRQTERPSPSGAENIQLMLSGQSFSTTSDNKESSGCAVMNTSHKPSLDTKKPLDTSSLTRPADASMAHKTCFSYRQLFSATEGFSDHKLLGEGTFGKVYLGTIHVMDCAIKKIHSSPADTHKKSDQVEFELAALLKFRHENIVTLYGYAQNNSDVFLVYQYLVSGSLEDRLLRRNNTPSLKWERRLNILVGACKGLNFLHTLEDIPLIHGDIKSANILLDQYYEAKIGDLGQARYATSQSTESSGFTHVTVAQATTKLFGTRAYIAPELRSGGELSIKSDVYALGVVLLEVCSGLPAYDPNRNDTFLVHHFNADVWDKGDELWKELVQDRTMDEVQDDVFIAVLKLARKCVNKIKKARPDTAKLLSEMKNIYKQNEVRVLDERNPDSISSSLQIDSSISSCGMPSDSGCQLERDVLPTIWQEQEKRFHEFSSIKTPKPELQHQLPLKVLPAEDSVELRTYHSSGNLVQSIPPNTPPSEAFRLQSAYDRQIERKKIDRLSEHSLKEDQLVEEYPSDPHKLQKIDEFDQLQQKSIPCQCEVLKSSDHIPKADPKKLAQLTAYDEANFPKTSPAEGDPSSLECDPVKLAFLTNFDDEVFKKPTLKNNCADSEQTNAVKEDREFYKQKENLGQKPTEQQMQYSQTGYPSNFTIDSPGSRPVYESHNTQQVMNEHDSVRYIQTEESHQNTGKDFEYLYYAPDHNGNRRPSDDSNVHNGWTHCVNEISTEKPYTEKPRKQKILALFSNYVNQKNNIDYENNDDNDCGNENVEETNT